MTFWLQQSACQKPVRATKSGEGEGHSSCWRDQPFDPGVVLRTGMSQNGHGGMPREASCCVLAPNPARRTDAPPPTPAHAVVCGGMKGCQDVTFGTLRLDRRTDLARIQHCSY